MKTPDAMTENREPCHGGASGHHNCQGFADPDQKRCAPCQLDVDAHEAVRTILRHIEVDPTHKDLFDTPARFLRALKEMTTPEVSDPLAALGSSFEMVKDDCDALSIVAQIDIRFSAVCRHHLMPFFGWADIAYMPTLDASGPAPARKLLGLSKLSRLVGACASNGLQLKESIATSILGALKRHECSQRGGLVILRARHGCMTCRGVKQQAMTATVAAYGALAEEPALRQQADALIHSQRAQAQQTRR